ncbi:MAG: S41 family peptidase [Deltaproteobacteria bacterium]|nr:S41 family peptidase [Deltaproteobacteria bacterium]
MKTRLSSTTVKKIIKIFTAAFVLASLLWMNKAQALSDKIYKGLSTFTRVLEIVDQLYVEAPDEDLLVEGAIQGMLSVLDPHTVYFPKEIYKNFSSDTKGRFGGVGIEVSMKDGVLTVISPLEDTPAWKAGIKSGDRIVAIDGESTKNMSLGHAVLKMRGAIGKKIDLAIWRDGKTKTFEVTRELIRVPAVKVSLKEDGIGYFKIVSFQEGVTKAFKKEIEEFRKEFGPLNAMILDLRDNPGGLLTEAVRLSDLFLDKGIIVSTKGRTQPEKIIHAHKGGGLTNIPVVLLINGGSASASEIVAGALGDHKRAKLLGTTSFGKGSVQTVVDLDNGDAVKITIAHYFTPKNKLIDGKGIKPDILLDEKLYKAKHKAPSVEDESDEKAKDKKIKITRDEFNEFQVTEAVEILKKMM